MNVRGTPQSDKVPVNHRTVFVPLLSIVLCVGMGIHYGLYYQPVEVVNWLIVTKNILFATISFSALIAIQNYENDTWEYYLFTVGFLLLLTGLYHETFAQFVQDLELSGSHIGLLAEVGLVVLGLGFLIWASEMNKKRRQLQQTRQRYHSLIETLPEGVVIVDRDDTITLTNSAFAQIVECPIGIIVSNKFTDYVCDDYLRIVEKEHKKRLIGQSSIYKIEMKTVHGKRKAVRVSVTPKFDHNREVSGAIGVITDITKREKIEKERTQKHRETKLYASLLRHDISNDLQAIMGYVEGVMFITKDIPEPAEDMLKSAMNAGHRMASLIKAFSERREHTHQSLVDLVQRVADEAMNTHRGLTVLVTAEPNATRASPLGGSFLPMALTNLFRNASQYGGESVRVRVNIWVENEEIRITVADDGPGIAESIIERIFQRGASTSGGGLGLYLTKQIIESCGGSIELLESQDSEGATFDIRLPISSWTDLEP